MKTQNHKHWPLVIMLAGVTFLVLTLYPRTSLSQTGVQKKELSAVGEPNNNNATVYELKEKAIERIFPLKEICGDRQDNNGDGTINEGCCGDERADDPTTIECNPPGLIVDEAGHTVCDENCQIVCEDGYVDMDNSALTLDCSGINVPDDCGNGSLDRPAEECDTTTAVPNAHCDQCEVVCDSGYTKTMVNNRIACVAEAICGDGSKNQPTEECDGTDGVTDTSLKCNDECELVCRSNDEPRTPGASCPECDNDGIPEDGEECDDGNTIETDGCSSNCQVTAYCGDNKKNLPNEDCDGTDGTYDSTTMECVDCEIVCIDTALPPVNGHCPACGDAVVNTGEECDTTTAVPNAHCDHCEIVCNENYTETTVNNRIACVAEAICGDGIKNQPTEECDGTDGAYDHTTMKCVACEIVCIDGYHEVGALGDFTCEPDTLCPNGTIDFAQGETCDPTANPVANGWDPATMVCIGCQLDCKQGLVKTIQISGQIVCTTPETCGDNHTATDEDCDASDPTSANPSSPNYIDPTKYDCKECELFCKGTENKPDIQGYCPDCGNNTVDPGEECEEGVPPPLEDFEVCHECQIECKPGTAKTDPNNPQSPCEEEQTLCADGSTPVLAECFVTSSTVVCVDETGKVLANFEIASVGPITSAAANQTTLYVTTADKKLMQMDFSAGDTSLKQVTIDGNPIVASGVATAKDGTLLAWDGQTLLIIAQNKVAHRTITSTYAILSATKDMDDNNVYALAGPELYKFPVTGALSLVTTLTEPVLSTPITVSAPGHIQMVAGAGHVKIRVADKLIDVDLAGTPTSTTTTVPATTGPEANNAYSVWLYICPNKDKDKPCECDNCCDSCETTVTVNVYVDCDNCCENPCEGDECKEIVYICTDSSEVSDPTLCPVEIKDDEVEVVTNEQETDTDKDLPDDILDDSPGGNAILSGGSCGCSLDAVPPANSYGWLTLLAMWVPVIVRRVRH